MWEIVLLSEPIALAVLRERAAGGFGEFVKGVVDVRQRTMTIGAELHADEEAHMLESGSQQADLWGINLYPDSYGTEDFVEFDSLINIRPSQDNRSRSVDDPATRRLIVEVVDELVSDD